MSETGLLFRDANKVGLDFSRTLLDEHGLTLLVRILEAAVLSGSGLLLMVNCVTDVKMS
jgi:hypothetical protein